MFSKKKSLPASKIWNKTFLSSFVSDLRKGGFSKIYVKLPINLDTIIKDKLTDKQIINSLQSRVIDIEDFLNRERNYRAIILVCENLTTKETIKILFGNISEKTSFGDDNFPSGHSASSTLYVQSPDMARVYPLFEFVYDYLSKLGKSSLIVSILGFFSIFFLAAEIITFLGQGKAFFQVMWSVNPAYDVIVAFICILLIYNYFKNPIGLSVNERETANIPNFIRRAIRGEMRDNPLVNIIVTVIATIIAGIALHFILP